MEKTAAVTCRAAQASDVDAIRAVYSLCEPQRSGCEKALPWLEAHLEQSRPLVVAVDETGLIGWASLSPYQSRCDLDAAMEASIYVSPRCQRQGLGKQLISTLLEMARARGYHCVIAVIWSDNEKSIAFAGSIGFEKAGELKEMALSGGKWRNMTLMQKLV